MFGKALLFHQVNFNINLHIVSYQDTDGFQRLVPGSQAPVLTADLARGAKASAGCTPRALGLAAIFHIQRDWARC